jgi:2,4-dienoyl-CoA reductase-like NADH-dependent reductase (Old Yellow Enzyme family)
VRLSTEDEAGWSLDDSLALILVLKRVGVDAIDCSAGGITNSSLLSKHAGEYGYQVDLVERVRAETGIPTIAVGLIVHADQAETILRNSQADLVAIGRELLYNPNWPIDAAQKLGVDPSFALAPLQHGFYLDRRAKSFVGRPSAFQVGIVPRPEL